MIDLLILLMRDTHEGNWNELRYRSAISQRLWLGHLLTEAMNAKHLLRFMKKKLKRFSEDIVDVVSAAFGVQIQDKDLYLGFTRKKPISLPAFQN